MSTPTILDYPGARYLYNVQAGQDAEEYATKDAFTGATDGTWKTLADLGITVS